MFKSDLEYNWDDQIEQVLNETFKKLETLINSLSNRRKKEQCINDIVDIFEKTLNSDASIESRRESSEKLSKISKETWIIWKNLMKQEVPNSENDRIQYFHKIQQVAKILKKIQIFEKLKLHR